VLLFQLLSGRLPHEHASLGDLLRAVAREPAPDLRTLRPNLSPALAAIVAKALHKQPAQRHADGHRLADDLAEVLHSGSGAEAALPRRGAKSSRDA
jgi:serine/threonine-protein kinase